MKTTLRLACLASVVPAAAAPCAGQADLNHHSYVTDKDAKAIYDFNIMQAARRHLGNLADSIIVAVTSCRSQHFTTECLNRLDTPGGVTSVAVSASRQMMCGRNDPEARCLEENIVSKEEKENNKTGLKISDNLYAHGWGPQYVNAIKGDATRTARQLHDFARENDYQTEARTWFADDLQGNGRGARLRVDGAKNVAGYWHSRTMRDSVNENAFVKAARETLRDAGFEDAELDSGYADKPRNIGVTIDRAATSDALIGNTGIIASFRTKLVDFNGPKRVFLYLWAHGGYEREITPKNDDPITGERKQGKVVTPTSPPSEMPTEQEFADDFFVGLDPDPELSVGANPRFSLGTVEETYVGPVEVLVDGFSLGTIEMLGSPAGSTYEMILDDPTWLAVRDSGIFDDGLIAISFEFPSGYFIVSTEWDLDLDELPAFGIGLATAAIRGAADIDCPADMNFDGVLNVFDFLLFQTAFNDLDPAADLAPPFGVFNIFDFLAFQSAYSTCV